MTAKRQRARREIILSIEEKENYESDIKNETNPNQDVNNKNSLKL